MALLDLDGVVYVGPHSVPSAQQALESARQAGMRLAFVTNNAARPPEAVAGHLRELGIPARPEEVITSAQAAAHYLAEQLPAGAAVLVVGTVGLYEALAERGLRGVASADEDVQAVVQGYSPTLNWQQLAEGAVAIRRGVPWVATNVDPTVPSPRGPLPGNGSLVAALVHATGATPTVTGKPDPTMHRETVQRTGAREPIVVGDRLDTDIEGANAAGCASLLVLTGVTSPDDLLAASPEHRPTYIAADLRGLLQSHRAPVAHDGVVQCGAWTARAGGAELVLAHRTHARDPARDVAAGTPARAGSDDDDLDALRALCRAAWDVSDRAGSAPPDGGWSVTAADERAAELANRLGLVRPLG